MSRLLGPALVCVAVASGCWLFHASLKEVRAILFVSRTLNRVAHENMQERLGAIEVRLGEIERMLREKGH